MATASEPHSGVNGQESCAPHSPKNGTASRCAERTLGVNGASHSNGKLSPVFRPCTFGSDYFPPPASWYTLIKDALDRILALMMLVLTSPLLLIAMVLVKATSRGPALYSQTRVGRFGKPFTIYKLRSMIVESESLTGACWSVPGDKRVTRVGHWLRRTHLDELPQLWNVLTGDMSLVGPRPERPEFVPMLEQAIPHYRDRLLVRPGITGFAQVQLPPDTDIESVRIKLAYDLFYVQTIGFWLDWRICWATALKMAGGRFGLLRRLFHFPRRETIEASYQRRSQESKLAPAPKTIADRVDNVNPLPLLP